MLKLKKQFLTLILITSLYTAPSYSFSLPSFSWKNTARDFFLVGATTMLFLGIYYFSTDPDTIECLGDDDLLCCNGTHVVPGPCEENQKCCLAKNGSIFEPKNYGKPRAIGLTMAGGFLLSCFMVGYGIHFYCSKAKKTEALINPPEA
jgi:hypothetical protein